MSAEDAAPTSEDRRSSAKDVSEGRIDRLRSDEIIEEDVPCSPEALKETLREGSGVVEEDRSVSALKSFVETSFSVVFKAQRVQGSYWLFREV